MYWLMKEKENGYTYNGDVMSIYLQLLLASFFWGTNVIVMKLLLSEVPFLLLATIRVLLSFLFLGLYMGIKHISFHCENKHKIIIISILAIYLNFYFTFLGMGEVKGIDNAFMNALAPLLTFVFSLFLLKKKGNIYEYIAIGLTLLAFLLSIHFQIFSIRMGFWYLFIGMILYMLGNVLIQRWKLDHTLSLSFYELFYGFIFLFLHCFLIGQFDIRQLMNIPFIYWILFILISGIGFAYIQVIYIKAIKCIGAFRTSFFLSLNPIVTYIESLVFLKEEFDYMHFIGFVLLGIAIYLMKGKSKKNPQNT